MKILKKYWYIPVIILLVVFLVYLLFPDVGQILAELEESKKKIQALKQEKERIQQALSEKISDNRELQKKKKELLKELEAVLGKEPEVIFKPVEKIETVVVEKEVYVPVGEYKKLFADCKTLQAAWENLKKKFSLYIKYDLSFEENVTKIIADYENLEEKNREIIVQLERDNEKLTRLAKKLKRRWMLAIGPGISTDFQGKLHLGLQLTVGYRLW